MDSLYTWFDAVDFRCETKNVLIRKKTVYINVGYCIFRCVFAQVQLAVLTTVTSAPEIRSCDLKKNTIKWGLVKYGGFHSTNVDSLNAVGKSKWAKTERAKLN